MHQLFPGAGAQMLEYSSSVDGGEEWVGKERRVDTARAEDLAVDLTMTDITCRMCVQTTSIWVPLVVSTSVCPLCPSRTLATRTSSAARRVPRDLVLNKHQVHEEETMCAGEWWKSD